MITLRNFLLFCFVFVLSSAFAQVTTNAKNSLLFYRLEKSGSYTLISDTAGKYAAEKDLKSSKEENVEIYYRYKGSDYTKANYTGEMTKIKLEVGKVQIPHGKGELTSENLKYTGKWKLGSFNDSGIWNYNGETYTGTFSHNWFSGTGFLKYANGFAYDGSWDNGKRSGNGTLYFPANFELPICEFGSVKASSLRVSWVNDSIAGEGRLTYSRPDDDRMTEAIKAVWKGFLLVENIDPTRRIYFSNPKTHYTGGIKAGKVEGKGEFVSPSLVKSGEWNNGKFKGRLSKLYEDKSVYNGSAIDDSREGIGTMEYSGGGKYEGSWSNNKRTGKGKFTWSNGTYYDGEWMDDAINGKGVMNFKNGEIWRCNWKSGLPIDSGEIEYASGAKYFGGLSGKYDGDVIRYFRQGYGRFYMRFPTSDTSYKNDSSYTGYYKEGFQHGKGNYSRVNTSEVFSESYNGDWFNGEKHGTGKWVYGFLQRNVEYQGEWKNNKKHGNGVMSSSEGMGISRNCKGTWIDDEMSGYAECNEVSYNMESGEEETAVKKGQYAADELQGQGSEISVYGTYTGNFENGIKNGTGKMVYKNGSIYEGEWKDGQPNGLGTMTLANKTVQKGNFINGEFQKPFLCKKVTVGTQVWMAENLRITRFKNGDEIPEAKTAAEWTEASSNRTPAFCYYNNDPSTAAKYGVLYNWYAANDPRGLAPEGWRVPSHVDVEVLRDVANKDIFDKQAAIKEMEANGINSDDARRAHDKFVDCGSPYLGGVKLYSRSACLGFESGVNCKKGTDVYGFGAEKLPYRESSGRFNEPQETTFWTTSHNTAYDYLGSVMKIDICGRFNSGDTHLEWWTRHWLYNESKFEEKGEGYAIRLIKQ